VVKYKEFLDKLPEAIYVETTNRCNLKCKMCHHGYGMTGPKGDMTWDLFKKIIDDISSIKDYNPRVALHMNGEPALHKEFLKLTSYASSKGLYTFIHTNGTLLNPKKAEELIQTGISEISFSFEGEDSDFYESIRVNAKFDKVVSNIQEILKVKGDTKIVVEVLKFHGKNPDLEISKRFKRLFPGAEFKSFYASDWHGSLEHLDFLNEPNVDYENPSICGDMMRVLPISWDGKVHSCCIDYDFKLVVGDLAEQSIEEAWRSSARKVILEKMSQGKHKEIDLCKNCKAPYTVKTKKRLVIGVEEAENV
jgi:radical SAM protein with 4Fe4S-binding SPASM domain